MPTTRTLNPHMRVMNGMDGTNPPHLVSEDKWIFVNGMRNIYNRLVQLPLYISQGTNFGAYEYLVSIPTGARNECYTVGWNGTGVFQVNFEAPSSSTLLQTLSGSSPSFQTDPGETSSQARMVGTMYANRAWFTKTKTRLKYTDGTYVGEFTTDVPSGRYIDNYFDHILIAHGTFKGMYEPWTVRWSDLYNPGIWTPSPENEADFFEISGWQRDESIVAGVTGLGKINDLEYVYTDSCVCRINYVGLPKIMQFVPVVLGCGNFFVNSLVVTKNFHFFFDGYLQNFFLFDGSNQPTPIGDPIIKYFLDNIVLIPTLSENLGNLIGFSLPERQEVWWVFQNLIGNYITLIYNWLAKEWSVSDDDERVTAIGGGGIKTLTINQLSGTIDALNGLIGNLGATTYKNPRTWCFDSALFKRPEVAGDVIGALQSPLSLPYLETKDFISELQEVNEVDRIAIHADYVNATGIDVYVSTRMSIQDPVTYKKVGIWTKRSVDGIVVFPAMTGRIVRYKFIFVDTILGKPRGCVFYSFTDNLFSIRAER